MGDTRPCRTVDLPGFDTPALIGFASATRDQVEANERLAFEKAVLEALPIEVPDDTSNADLHELFVKSIERPDDTSAGAYRLTKDGRAHAYAVAFEGRGFWNVIRGVIGLRYNAEQDRWDTTGIAFYEQNETPGLGAEIIEPRFRDQFSKNKQLLLAGELFTFVPESAEAGPSEINAITGATQTCSRLERIINERLAVWREKMAKPPGAKE